MLSKHDRLLRLEREQCNHTLELNDEQIRLLERFSAEFRERQIEVHHIGELVAIDTFFVGTLKGVGKVYLQTVLDCYSRFAFGRLHNSKLPLTAVHVLNNDVLPHFEQQGLRIETLLSDNGREYCGRPDQHPFELFLQLEGIKHRRTGADARKATASSSGCIAPCWTSTSALRAARPGMNRSTKCRETLMPICITTTTSGRIKVE